MHYEHRIIDADDLVREDEHGHVPGDDNWRVVGVIPVSVFRPVLGVILERER